MKTSAVILSVCGFCVLYICNADWIDELIEAYLGTDYEEVAPFISSVTAGTEEFDHLVKELRESRRRGWFRPPLALLYVLGACVFSLVLYRRQRFSLEGCCLAEAAVRLAAAFRNPGKDDKEEIQNLVTQFLEKRLKQMSGGPGKEGEDVPVQLLWKGGTLIESSVHCSIREDSKAVRFQKQFKLVEGGGGGGGGDESLTLEASGSEESTAQKMADIRRLLESEQEINGAAPEESASGCRPGEPCAGAEEPEVPDPDGAPDPKLMSRIRLLESRLRLEELKNKHWISRMSRAEGILQQLNKQVERIEETRPVETLTETLRITSTVTNWPANHPRRNVQFTLVNRHPLFRLQTPYTSLSELIEKEVGLPSSGEQKKDPCRLAPSPPIPALPSPNAMAQSTFLSKFLCR